MHRSSSYRGHQGHWRQSGHGLYHLRGRGPSPGPGACRLETRWCEVDMGVSPALQPVHSQGPQFGGFCRAESVHILQSLWSVSWITIKRAISCFQMIHVAMSSQIWYLFISFLSNVMKNIIVIVVVITLWLLLTHQCLLSCYNQGFRTSSSFWCFRWLYFLIVQLCGKNLVNN